MPEERRKMIHQLHCAPLRMIFLLPFSFFLLIYYLSWSAAAISFVNLSTKAFLFLPAQSKS